MILLTDGMQRKTLAAVRSLGMRGVDVLAAEDTRFNPSVFSRYCSRHFVCPSPKYDGEEYYEWLKRIVKQYECDVIFPMDDCTMDIIMEHKHELDSLSSLPLPPYESYKIACDKGESAKLAESSGVYCPKTYMPGCLEDLYKIVNDIKYPVVIKPRHSSGSRGIRKADTQDELINIYIDVDKTYPMPVIQEYIGCGIRYDVCLLYDMESKLCTSFVQKELRHFPVEMGPSTVQQSVDYPELVKMSAAMIEKLNWKGIVEIEYMVDDRDGKPKFMEINPRFWASLQMAIDAGVDFPWLLYNIALGKQVEEVHEYKTGLRCRWLLPGDILHFITNKNRFKMDPPFFSRIKDDTVWLKDPMPVLGFILACFRYLFDIKMWKMMFRR